MTYWHDLELTTIEAQVVFNQVRTLARYYY